MANDLPPDAPTDDLAKPATVTCPAGICQKQAAVFDHDRMFGHLMVDHSWTFDTAQEWVLENMEGDP